MINYDLKKIRLMAFDVDGVLSANATPLAADGQPQRSANVKDGYALHHAAKVGLKLAIISGGFSVTVRDRYVQLGCQDVHIAVSRKIDVYEGLLGKYCLKDENVLFMGDDIPDYEIMSRCGCPCCPRDAAPEIRDAALYVSHYDGGMGCVRDVVEQVLKSQGLWMNNELAFAW